MAKSNRKISIAAMLLTVAMTFVACSTEDMPSVNRLPEGKYPLSLSSTVLQSQMNSKQALSAETGTVFNNWYGVTKLAVQTGALVKEYDVTSSPDGMSAKLTSTDPFYWESLNETKTITAWHPYSTEYPTAWTVKADQSIPDNYKNSDLIKGELKDLAFADRDNATLSRMTFHHQTAKMAINLLAADGITLDENTSVMLTNLSGVEGNGNTIATYRPVSTEQSFVALVAPQTVAANSEFIQIKVADKTYCYKPEDAKVLSAATAYIYNITLSVGSIEVEEIVASGSEWNNTGNQDTPVEYYCYKPTDLKLGDFYYSDGTTSDGGLRKIKASDSTIVEWADVSPLPEKTWIGIVFKAGRHENDNSDYSGVPLDNNEVHGYVVALHDVNKSVYCSWSSSSNTTIGCLLQDANGNYIATYDRTKPSELSDNDWNGYEWTHKIIKVAKENGSTLQTDFQATNFATVEYENEINAPTGSTGWFLPSISQLNRIYKLNDNSQFFKSGSSPLKIDYYWSSSEDWVNPHLNAVALKILHVHTSNQYSKIEDDAIVRSILVF